MGISTINTNKEQVYKDAENGAFEGMTQAQLKDYAAANKSTKAKLIKTYTAKIIASDGTSAELLFDSNRKDGTIDEWKDLYKSFEVVTISADKEGNKRMVVIYPNGYAELVTLTEYKPNANGKTKTTTGKAEFLARAAAEGMTDEQIATVCKVMGW